MLKLRCKAGHIQLTDAGTLQIVQPFGAAIWQAPAADVTAFTTQPGPLNTLTVTIHAGADAYTAEMVSAANFEKLRDAFPHLHVEQAGREWYHSPTALTHVETYESEKRMQRDVEAAARHGWQIQGQSGSQSKASGAAMLGGAIVAGPVGAIIGAQRSKKNQITVSFVRSPEWLASRPQH